MTSPAPPPLPAPFTLPPRIPLADEPIYAWAELIRMSEELLLELFTQGVLSGTTHTCLGQELCQLAVVRALTHPEDRICSNHRNHGHFLTYSGQFAGLLAEVTGRAAGVCGGMGGSQHLAWNHFHSNGVQGGMSGIAVGQALAAKWRADGSLAALFIGDGTLGQGLVYESLNLAALWRVPLLVVVENNQIAQTTPTPAAVAGSIPERGRAFGITTWQLEDRAPDFCARAAECVAQVRASGAPGMLIIATHRLGPHSKGDDLRPREELESLQAHDPLAALGRRLEPHRREEITLRNREFIAATRAWALEQPLASQLAEAPYELAETLSDSLPPWPPTPRETMREGLNRALGRLLEHDPRVVVLGEDLHDPYGGAFKVTAGLSTRFPGRVISTPISEAAITGAAIGLALSGYRPVVEVMFGDFLTLVLDQLCNHALKFPVLARCELPLVIRAPVGGGRGYGPTHSQSLESLFAALPGLTVVYPSPRHRCGELLERAVNGWPFPILWLEHKLGYAVVNDPGEYLPLPGDERRERLFSTLARLVPAPDLIIITYGGMVLEVDAAVQQLSNDEELAVGVIIPALLNPLPIAGIAAAVGSCARVVVVEEGYAGAGVGAELVAGLAERGFRGVVRRVAALPVPIPAARELERQVLPGRERIVAVAVSLFG